MNTKFVKVRCTKCKNEQVIYSNASTPISCLVCQETMATPTGGKAKIAARVLEVLD